MESTDLELADDVNDTAHCMKASTTNYSHSSVTMLPYITHLNKATDNQNPQERKQAIRKEKG